MAGESSRKRLWEESTCSICLDTFRDPVILSCGHNFCKDCITTCWEERTSPQCPHCRQSVQKKLRPNKQLASLIQISQELNSSSQGEAAALGRKDQLSQSLQFLRNEREKMLVYKTESDKESQDLLDQIEAVKENSSIAFSDLHHSLVEQEKHHMAQIEEVEMEIAGRRAKLSGELSSLENLIQELEEKELLLANELIEDPGNILERCPKESFEKPVAFPISLKWRIHEFSGISSFLKGIMNTFRETLSTEFAFQKANVTVDPDSAHPCLILSADRKNIRWTPRCQDLPDNAERFDTKLFVLGCEGFTAGRHYWEVTIENKGFGAVGVARKTVKRKGIFDMDPKEGFWSISKWGGEHRIFIATGHSSFPLNEELKRIRVNLDCVGGQVAFFDADTAVRLHVYTDAALHGETLLPFFSVTVGGELTLCP